MFHYRRHSNTWFLLLLSFVLLWVLTPQLIKAQSAEPTPYPTGPWPTATPWPAPDQTQPPALDPAPAPTQPPAPAPTQPPAPAPTQPPAPDQTQPPVPDQTQPPAPAPTVVFTPRPAITSPPTLSPQQFLPPTSTPDAEGVIYSVVGPSDSLWSIAAKGGITLQELVKLNNLPSENVFVNPGDKLIIGYGSDYQPKSTEEATAISTITATSGVSESIGISDTVETSENEVETSLPTETPVPSAELCLSAFDDLNENLIRDEGEAVRPDVTFNIFLGNKSVSTYLSVPEQTEFCISGLQPGAYRISRSRLPNEKLTSSSEIAVTLADGSSVALPFGSVLVQAEPTVPVVLTGTASADTSASTNNDPTQLTTNASNTILVAIIIATVLLFLAVMIIILSRRPRSG